MAYKYTAKFQQSQKVADVKLNPNGGVLTEREFKNIKKDVYGASLLEKGLLVVVEDTADNSESAKSEDIPEFE